MNRGSIVGYALAIVLGTSAVAVAQNPQGQGGRLGRHGGGNYDPATEITFTGTVDEVRNTGARASQPGGLHLMVRTDAGLQEVHLGPASYVSSKGFVVAKGDTVTVTGSKMTIDAQQVTIAREVKKGDQVLTLRDQHGIPLWSGRGRRSS
jgi:hypothetical protein